MKRSDGTTIRQVGSTELSMCKSLAGGTGLAVVGLLFSKHHEVSSVQNILSHLQTVHPILRSRLRYLPPTKTYSFVTFPASYIKVQELDVKATSKVLQPDSPSSSLMQIVEHELNENIWVKIHSLTNDDLDVFCARTYELENGMRVLALQFLTAVIDQPSGISLLKEILARLAGQDVTTQRSCTEINVAIEDLNPKKNARSVLSKGKSLLSNTLTAVGLTNLSFKDTKSLPRSSRIIQLELDQHQTRNLLAGCESKGIKLFSALAAAGMIAAHSANTNRKSDNFGVVTVLDCRPSLIPPLSLNDTGLYSSGLLTSHTVTKTESFWKLSEKIYSAFTKSKKAEKHFSELALYNYLLCKVIENPGLTPSSAQRTSLLTVFEDPGVIDKECWLEEVSLEDYIICASAHGVGPSITISHTLHVGRLKCTVVYPSPLHSREQIANIVDKMKNILISA